MRRWKLVRWVLDWAAVKPARYVRHELAHEGLPDVYKVLQRRAAEESADYIAGHLANTLLFTERDALWAHALGQVTLDGTYLEFGVWKGDSIDVIAAQIGGRLIYGFDSFMGLAEDYPGTGYRRGAFGLGGQMPKTRSNVRLVKGWFSDTVPQFLSVHPEPIAFLHMDADTYETTAQVLDLLWPRMTTGTVIVFDEYTGYPNWRNGEFRAWHEFVARHNIAYRYLGFALIQAAIVMA